MKNILIILFSGEKQRMDNEQIWKSGKYICTIFLSILFMFIVISGFQNGFTLLTVLSFISMILYIVCLVYVANNKRYVYLLTVGMLNGLVFMFTEMLYNVFKQQQGDVPSLVWLIAVVELGIIGITLFPGKYLYLHKIAKQKIKKYDWGKGSLIILTFGVAVRYFYRKVSPLISNDQEILYSALLVLVISIMFQIVNWIMIFKFVTEKRNLKNVDT